MIISFILGGLGNQLFQYAAGRQIAHSRKVPLKLETRGFSFPKYAAHAYRLDRFNIIAEKTRPSDYLKLAPLALRRQVLVRERNGLNQKVSEIPDGTILVGYWQHPKYFSDIAGLLRQELTLRDEARPEIARTSEKIRNTESISLHVRRTDYVSNPRNVEIFEQLSLDYYRAAMDLVAARCASPHFFVFSDDPDWTKTHLPDSRFRMTFVTNNDAHEDLTLMQQCQHNIIANSTFSWWGAWLNANAEKVVVSPKRWFKDGVGKESDLLPPDWIRL